MSTVRVFPFARDFATFPRLLLRRLPPWPSLLPPTPLLLTLVFPVHTPRPSIPPVPFLRYPNPDRLRPGGERVRGRETGRGVRIRKGSRDCWFFFPPLFSLCLVRGAAVGGVFGRWRPLLRGKCWNQLDNNCEKVSSWSRHRWQFNSPLPPRFD